MAFGHKLQVTGSRIIDRNKIGHQFLRRIDNRKIFLMFPHGGNQHFVGKLQKVFVKFARNGHWILNQVFDNVHQFLVGQNAAADFFGRFTDFTLNCFAPFIKIDQDSRIFQTFQISSGGIDFDFSRLHKIMPVSVAPAAHVSQFKWNHFGAQQRQAGMNRSGKGNIQVSPAHGLRKRRTRYDLRQNIFE